MRYRKKDETTWTFICRAKDFPASSAQTFRIVLQDENGERIVIPEQDFHQEYVAISPMTGTMANEAIKETLALIRTQSAIRFAALPFFLTALAVLANASHNKDGGFKDMPETVALVGAGLSLIAIVIEIIISRNLIVFWKAIQSKDTGGGKNKEWEIVYTHRNNGALKSARTALIIPYLAALYYWIFQLWNLWGFPVCGAITISPGSWDFPTETSWAVLEGGLASLLVVVLVFGFAWYIWETAKPVEEESKPTEKTSKRLLEPPRVL